MNHIFYNVFYFQMSSSNHSLATPEWLNSEYLQNMLREYFKEKSLKIENFTVSPGSKVGDNYVCQVLRIVVELTTNNQKKSISMIGKIMPDTDLSKALTKFLDFFNVEKMMMTETLPVLYRKLCERGDTERFFPFLYKLDIGNKMIFMEDLKQQGFQMVNRTQALDLDHTLLVVKSLAKMHAAGYLLLKDDPSHKNQYLNHYFKNDKEIMVGKYIEGAIKYVVDFLDLYPISEEDKNIFRKFQGRLYDLMCDSYERKESSFNVIIHGDCWLNNMMFKYENEKVAAVRLIDFQLSNYNSFVLDLFYNIFTSVKAEVITENLEKLLKTYYETFVSVTGEIEGFNMGFN